VLERLSGEPAELPLRAPAGTRLRPRVKVLRVRGADEAWAAALRQALERETYAVGAGA